MSPSAARTCGTSSCACSPWRCRPSATSAACPNKLDGQGNYTIGITDFTIFPEIVVENNKRSMGMDITLVTSAPTDEEARELLKALGMPFRRIEPAAPAKTSAA